jgi:hypothetical protein
LHERGLTAVGIVELDFSGRGREVLAEEFAECGPGGDVGVAIAMEGKAAGPSVLISGERGLPSNRGQALRVVGKPPDVDFTGIEAQGGPGRAQPFGLGRGWHRGILC